MSPADAAWYRGDTERNRLLISSLVWLDGPLQVDEWRTRVQERVLDRHPAFRQRIVPSRIPGRLPRWEDVDDLDLDDHVRVVDLPAPGDHALLEARCSLERSTPLDRDRPLWSATIYRGYRGEGTLIHTRMHHSLGDGIALMRVFLTLVDEQDPGDPPLAEDRSLPGVGGLLGLGRDAVRFAAEHAAHPGRVLATARQAVSVAGQTAKVVLPEPVARQPLQGRPHGVQQMSWDPDGYPLEQVKAQSERTGATVNDLLLAVVTGALRRELEQRDALVAEVAVMMPVSLRDPAEPIPEHPGNRLGAVPIRLPVGLADPDERLVSLRAQTEKLKDSPVPLIVHTLLRGAAFTAPPIERGLLRFNQWRSTGVITNVPGPSGPLHVAGTRVAGSVGWGGLVGDLALSGAFVSLSGRVFPGFVTDTAVIEDPGRLLDHLRAAWHEVVEVGGG